MILDFITAGQIVNTHGIRGELKLLPCVDVAILDGLKTLYINGTPYTVSASRIHKGCLLVKLPNVDDMDSALPFKNKTVTLRRQDVTLPEGTYFDEELIGLTARDAATGDSLGTLEEVMEYPAHKVYVVRGGKDEYLIPAVPAFVKGIDLSGNTIDIHVWEGMGSHEN